MKKYNVYSVSFRLDYNWNMISRDFAIMYFKLEQLGPHSEWTVVNESSVAISADGTVDVNPKSDNYKKEFEKWIINEARARFSKMKKK